MRYPDRLNRILFESKCTFCGDARAYIGATSVECPNPNCRFYNAKQAQAVQPPAQAQVQAQGNPEDDPHRPEHWQKILRDLAARGIQQANISPYAPPGNVKYQISSITTQITGIDQWTLMYDNNDYYKLIVNISSNGATIGLPHGTSRWKFPDLNDVFDKMRDLGLIN